MKNKQNSSTQKSDQTNQENKVAVFFKDEGSNVVKSKQAFRRFDGLNSNENNEVVATSLADILNLLRSRGEIVAIK